MIIRVITQRVPVVDDRDERLPVGRGVPGAEPRVHVDRIDEKCALKVTTDLILLQHLIVCGYSRVPKFFYLSFNCKFLDLVHMMSKSRTWTLFLLSAATTSLEPWPGPSSKPR